MLGENSMPIKKKTTPFGVVFVTPWLLRLCLRLGFRLGRLGNLRNLHSGSIIRFEGCPNDIAFRDSASFGILAKHRIERQGEADAIHCTEGFFCFEWTGHSSSGSGFFLVVGGMPSIWRHTTTGTEGVNG